jgi:hypothetical protein
MPDPVNSHPVHPLPHDLVRDMSGSRARLIAFAAGCSDEQWVSCPLGEGDRRSVSVIVDHVADSYEYIGGWVKSLVGGGTVDVDTDDVDQLNAMHASNTTALQREEVIEHLNRSGDQFIDLVAGLTSDDLAIDGGRVARMAQIAYRHADSHRSEIEAALAPGGA